jgi:hypothetical protein
VRIRVISVIRVLFHNFYLNNIAIIDCPYVTYI